jgi:hypothetical protein
MNGGACLVVESTEDYTKLSVRASFASKSIHPSNLQLIYVMVHSESFDVRDMSFTSNDSLCTMT